MSILITGITGYLGSNLVKELRKRYPNRKIRALVLPIEKNKCEQLSELDIEFHFGNLSSRDSLHGCFEGIDSAIHLAAVVDDLSPMPSFYETNHNGTKNLLEEFIKSESSSFVYMSTMGIYGFKLPNSPIDETRKPNLIPGYRESKYFGEQEVFKYANEYGFKASALRPPIFFGPGDYHWTPNIYNLVQNGRKIPLISGGEVSLAYSYVEDVVDALIKLEKLEKANNEIFNQASFHVTLKEIFETAAKILEKDIKTFNLNYHLASFLGFLGDLQWKMFKRRPLLDKYRVMQLGTPRIVNTDKIERILGVSTKYTFEEALTKTFNWYKSQEQ